jgi:hypothetical protein
MQDFDANEDFIRLTGAGRDDLPDPVEIDPIEFKPLVVRRARMQPEGHHAARWDKPRRRVGVALIARRRFATRLACPYGRRVPVLAPPPRRTRRLWTKCHGRPPGSPS